MKLKKINSQTTQQNDPPAEVHHDAAAQDQHVVPGQQDEQAVVEQFIIGFHSSVVSSLYSSWKESELEYANNMTNLFNSVRKQNDKIAAGLEEMKVSFRDFLSKSDNKQDKLDHFIESFNKFTEEFPELRPDDQTKEELNSR